MPGDAGEQLGGESAQAPFIGVGERRLLGPGDGLLPEQVGAAVDGPLEAAREDAHRETGEGDLQPGAVGLDRAAFGLIRRPVPADLLGVVQGRIPEDVPAVLLGESVTGPAHPGRHAELRHEVPRQGLPLALLPSDRQLEDGGSALHDRKPSAQLLPLLAIPAHGQSIILGDGLQPRLRTVAREVAGRRPRGRGKECGTQRRGESGKAHRSRLHSASARKGPGDTLLKLIAGEAFDNGQPCHGGSPIGIEIRSRSRNRCRIWNRSRSWIEE